MKVEILIFAYLAVCASMIVFNIVCIFVFRHRDKKIDSSKIDFETEIKQCIDNKAVDSKHREFLMKKLKKEITSPPLTKLSTIFILIIRIK